MHSFFKNPIAIIVALIVGFLVIKFVLKWALWLLIIGVILWVAAGFVSAKAERASKGKRDNGLPFDLD